MTPLVDVEVDAQRRDSPRVLRDDDLGAALVEFGDDGVAVESLSATRPPKWTPSRSGSAPTVSKRWPGGSSKRTRLLSASVSARIWWSCRLSSGLWPGAKSPFCALIVTVHLHDRRIDHGVLHVGLFRAGFEQSLEHVSLAPVAVATKRRAPVAKHLRQVAPGAARACDPEHRLQNRRLSRPLRPGPGGLTQTVRLHLRSTGRASAPCDPSKA